MVDEKTEKRKYILLKRLVALANAYNRGRNHEGSSRFSWVTALLLVSRFRDDSAPDFNVTYQTETPSSKELTETKWRPILELHAKSKPTEQDVLSNRKSALPDASINCRTEFSDLLPTQSTFPMLMRFGRSIGIFCDKWRKEEQEKYHRPGIKGTKQSTLAWYYSKCCDVKNSGVSDPYAAAAMFFMTEGPNTTKRAKEVGDFNFEKLIVPFLKEHWTVPTSEELKTEAEEKKNKKRKQNAKAKGGSKRKKLESKDCSEDDDDDDGNHEKKTTAACTSVRPITIFGRSALTNPEYQRAIESSFALNVDMSQYESTSAPVKKKKVVKREIKESAGSTNPLPEIATLKASKKKKSIEGKGKKGKKGSLITLDDGKPLEPLSSLVNILPIEAAAMAKSTVLLETKADICPWRIVKIKGGSGKMEPDTKTETEGYILVKGPYPAKKEADVVRMIKKLLPEIPLTAYVPKPTVVWRTTDGESYYIVFDKRKTMNEYAPLNDCLAKCKGKKVAALPALALSQMMNTLILLRRCHSINSVFWSRVERRICILPSDMQSSFMGPETTADLVRIITHPTDPTREKDVERFSDAVFDQPLNKSTVTKIAAKWAEPEVTETLQLAAQPLFQSAKK